MKHNPHILALACLVISACQGPRDTTATAPRAIPRQDTTADIAAPGGPDSIKLAIRRGRADQPLPAPIEYTVLEELVTDQPDKAMVRLEILVSALPEPGLRELLLRIYGKALERPFKYHEQPTVVAIYAYRSVEHYGSGLAQWVGMLFKGPSDRGPEISIKREVLSAEFSPPGQRYGLTEVERRALFRELILAERRAERQANRAYPLDGRTLDGWSKWETLFERLRKEYAGAVASKHNLDRLQLESIGREGIRANWPIPKR
jgi:hypothetical protein